MIAITRRVLILLVSLVVVATADKANDKPKQNNLLPEDLWERVIQHPHGRHLQGLPPNVAPEIGIIGLSISILDLSLVTYETTLSLRLTNYFGALFWNCVAAYSTDYSDAITERPFFVPVLDQSMHTTANRAVCVAQSIVTYNSFSMPEALDPHADAMINTLGIPVEKTLNPAIGACTGRRCLRNLAANNGYNPILMGQIVAKAAYDRSLDDGWNQLGTDTGCQVHCRNYTDTTGFVPSNPVYGIPPGGPVQGFNDGWKPLMEDNGKGYFCYQEHVTPHIGTEAKLRFLPNRERRTRQAPNPQYSRSRLRESRQVIDRMATLNDQKIIEVQQFDDKLIVVNALIGAFIGKTVAVNYQDPDLGQPGLVLSFERFCHFAMALTAADYDAIIMAWKAKVEFDLIRPTTVIKEEFGPNRMITTWAPGGVQTFPASDFEALVRVMPHSEYVSGSACLFTAQKDFILGYLAAIGVSDPSDFPIVFPTVMAGESKVDPGLVPASDITLQYPGVEQMARVGSDSRLDGGMHFEASVTGAEALCAGVADFAIVGALGLYA